MAEEGTKADTDYTGMARRVKKPQIPTEFVTPGKDFFERLAKSRLTDDNHVKKAILLWGKLQRLGMTEQIEQLGAHLIGTGAVGGRLLELMAMTHIGIYFDKDASKEEQKNLAEMQKRTRQEATERREKEQDGFV